MDAVRNLASATQARRHLHPLLKAKNIQPYFVGMGQTKHALDFAAKMRLDLLQWPILVDPGPSVAGDAYPTYRYFGLVEPSGLVDFATQTIDFNTILSSTRSILEGNLPAYGAGGSVTQLGGL